MSLSQFCILTLMSTLSKIVFFTTFAGGDPLLSSTFALLSAGRASLPDDGRASPPFPFDFPLVAFGVVFCLITFGDMVDGSKHG